MTERDPVEAAKLLRAVEADLPIFDDYLRLWIAEALVKQNEPIQAAELLEMIPKLVPDSNLLAKAAYRTGEAWYSGNVCARAVEWLDRAVTLADKDASAPVALWHQADCHVKENRPSEAARLRAGESPTAIARSYSWTAVYSERWVRRIRANHTASEQMTLFRAESLPAEK